MRLHPALLALLAMCKPTDPTATPTKTEPTPSAPSSSASVAPTPLPPDFPARGAPKLNGTLAGRPFSVAKAMLRVTPDDATLYLYSWSEGGACEPQFAPSPEQLYVSVSAPGARVKSGAVLRTHEDGVLLTYKRPTSGSGPTDTATIVLDDVDGARAAGRLQLNAPDGTRVAGAFEATVCTSAQQPAAVATSLLGVAWGTEKDPASLPNAPLTATLVGKTASPATVEAIDWDDGSLSQHEIHFFMTRPRQSCGFDQSAPGFKIGFPSAFKKGLDVRTSVSTVTTRGSAFAVVLWDEPGGVLGVEGRGFVSAVIDDATPNELRGRVLAWFEDASKSMIAGAFTAKRCHVKP